MLVNVPVLPLPLESATVVPEVSLKGVVRDQPRMDLGYNKQQRRRQEAADDSNMRGGRGEGNQFRSCRI